MNEGSIQCSANVFWCVLLLVSTFLPSPSFADLYKYTNEDGITVLDSTIPARYVKGGYTIMNQEGRVIEVVPPALSEDEIRDRDRKLAEEQAREKKETDRKVADQDLLRIYSTPDDVIRARDTKIASIESALTPSA